MKRSSLFVRCTVVFVILIAFGIIWEGRSYAVRSFIIEKQRTYYGIPQWIKLDGETTLLDIARNFDLGYNQIIGANPGVDPWIPGKGTLVFLPDGFILPQDRLEKGIVVNLAEMRLYYFTSDGANDYVLTCPVGVGQEGFLTVLGLYHVKSKTPHPTWYVPESIRKEDPTLPPEVPPGPDNPLGAYIFRLSRLAYGIHGTNMPWGVGRRVSHGCIRLYPEDIATLFPMVPTNTMVRVTYEPIKVGWAGETCWLQVFDDFDGRVQNPLEEALTRMKGCERFLGPLDVDEEAIRDALLKKDGIPRAVGRPREMDR